MYAHLALCIYNCFLSSENNCITENLVNHLENLFVFVSCAQIQEWCEKAVLLNAKGEPRTAGGGGGAASRPATAPPAKAGSEAPKAVARPATAKPAAGVGVYAYDSKVETSSWGRRLCLL